MKAQRILYTEVSGGPASGHNTEAEAALICIPKPSPEESCKSAAKLHSALTQIKVGGLSQALFISCPSTAVAVLGAAENHLKINK